jgi:hypothetical protein
LLELLSLSFYKQLKNYEMDKLNSLIAAVILTVLVACQKDNSGITQTPRAVNLADTLSIKMGETVFSGDFSVKFDSITGDSRCPIDYNCITAGMVITKLLIKKQRDSQFVRLTSPRLSLIGLNDTVTVFNRLIRLTDVSPYPKGNIQIQQKDYVVKLFVQ